MCTLQVPFLERGHQAQFWQELNNTHQSRDHISGIQISSDVQPQVTNWHTHVAQLLAEHVYSSSTRMVEIEYRHTLGTRERPGFVCILDRNLRGCHFTFCVSNCLDCSYKPPQISQGLLQ
jgi:hypothetical protein